MDRRAAFFLAVAVVCFLLVPISNGYAWVSTTVGVVYVVLTFGSWLDAGGRRPSDGRARRPAGRPTSIRRAAGSASTLPPHG